MQLRAARLCLDCEELHVDDRCPVCASEQYAFLSAWLPSEERRRWRRPSTRASEFARRPVRQVVRVVARWMGFDVDDIREHYRGPRTRASDRMPDMNFDPAHPVSKPQPAAEPVARTQER
jgi:hypothetical protein